MEKEIPESWQPELGIDYPDLPDQHMGDAVKDASLVVDENYPYLDKSLSFRLRSALIYFGIFALVFWVSPLRYGLKIEGRNILKKFKKELANGAMTVCNHVLRWDFLMVLQAVRWRRLYFPAWQTNLGGKDRNFIRLTGGIPVPESISGMRAFTSAFDELHAAKKWIHVFPESANWPYFRPIRPFKKGMFSMAVKYKLPVLPLAISYREPHGIYRLFKRRDGKLYPNCTIRLGEPVFPDASLSRRDAVNLLRRQTHESIVRLAGIKANPYPPEGD
jgi:1-acyl-sn-glycerol-3-phosphate acyltransferase